MALDINWYERLCIHVKLGVLIVKQGLEHVLKAWKKARTYNILPMVFFRKICIRTCNDTKMGIVDTSFCTINLNFSFL